MIKDYEHIIECVYSHYPDVVRHVKSKGVDECDVYDVASLVILIAISNISKLRSPQKLVAWMRTITENEINRYHNERSSRWKNEISAVSYDNEDGEVSIYEIIKDDMTVEGWATNKERNFHLRDALKQLKEVDRKIFTLHAVDRVIFRDIAKSLNMNPNTVRSRYCRTVTKLREYLEGKD